MPEDVKNFLLSIDYVPPSLPPSTGRAILLLLEDNDAVIKMIIKGRSPALRHVVRTHRVDLDWLFERIREDPGVPIRFIGTKSQIADMLTKGVHKEKLDRYMPMTMQQVEKGRSQEEKRAITLQDRITNQYTRRTVLA